MATRGDICLVVFDSTQRDESGAAVYVRATARERLDGSLLAGLAADRFGASWAIGISGGVCVASGLWLAARPPALRATVRPRVVHQVMDGRLHPAS